MEYIESPEQMAERIQELQGRVQEMEEAPSRSELMMRLAQAYPLHPARIAKVFFLLLLLGSIGLLGASLGVGFLADDNFQQTVGNIETRMGVPLPLIFGICALCMGLAWLAAGQAALVVARDCPRLPWEEDELKKIEEEIQRLEAQRSVANRIRGTPMGARPRIATPVPLSMRGAGTTPVGPPRMGTPTGPPRRATPLGPPLRGTPLGPPRRGTPLGPPRRTSPIGPPRRTGTPLGPPRRSTPLGPPRRTGTPLAPPSRTGGTPIGASSRAGYTPPPDSGSPIGAPPQLGTPIGGNRAGGMTYQAPALGTPSSPAPRENIEYIAEPATDGPSAYTIGVDNAPAYSHNGGFEQRHSTHFPNWGPVDEPWLEDAIEKAEILASGYPVQAHLEFSPEPSLPFALILERATPAMAVRAMVSYVDFLASIATPPRARIELRSVAHLDRGFHRNVAAALEPYFPDTVEVAQNGHIVEIKFREPDEGWTRHPFLPIEN